VLQSSQSILKLVPLAALDVQSTLEGCTLSIDGGFLGRNLFRLKAIASPFSRS